MIVYRVEHGGTGDGPHTQELNLPICHDATRRRPAAPCLAMKYQPLTFRFGFSSLWQAARWFHKRDRSILREHGCVLVKLEVPEEDVIYRDNFQVAFLTKSARLIKVAV